MTGLPASYFPSMTSRQRAALQYGIWNEFDYLSWFKDGGRLVQDRWWVFPWDIEDEIGKVIIVRGGSISSHVI